MKSRLLQEGRRPRAGVVEWEYLNSQEQAQRVLQKRLECYEELRKYERMIDNYQQTGEITELASETEEQLNKRIDAIDVPWLFKLKHRLQGIFYYKNEWLENHINSNGSYDGGYCGGYDDGGWD